MRNIKSHNKVLYVHVVMTCILFLHLFTFQTPILWFTPIFQRKKEWVIIRPT
jgi:hypothetical protein